jgi:hypothetical protein
LTPISQRRKDISAARARKRQFHRFKRRRLEKLEISKGAKLHIGRQRDPQLKNLENKKVIRYIESTV